MERLLETDSDGRKSLYIHSGHQCSANGECLPERAAWLLPSAPHNRLWGMWIAHPPVVCIPDENRAPTRRCSELRQWQYNPPANRPTCQAFWTIASPGINRGASLCYREVFPRCACMSPHPGSYSGKCLHTVFRQLIT